MSFLKDILSIDKDERTIRALERIADALERLAPPPISVVLERAPQAGNLIETTDESLCQLEQQEAERLQTIADEELERNKGKQSPPAT